MSSRPTFTILCCVQIFIGFTMILLGIGDRVTVAAQCSYLMLPIWIGALAGFVGCYGLIIGHQNRRFHNRNAERHGFHNRDAESAIKAINISCVGLSFLVLYLYGSVLSFIGFNNESGSIVGIFSTAVIMCFAEMFVGCGLAIIDRNQMVCDSPVQQLGRGYGVVRNMNFPSNQENLPGNQTQLDKSIKRDSDETMLL
ncbi:uncharacterized protein LOC110244892 isoform X2 [Exaiptasia diaphana]|uniref:Uncharacterized protein n=1 Tax=Exaiptasia diaphana TaxID=2652724 RepID=A0A913YNC8_EXADI|nr:uncharacterized protein LOC110244892 isoform X2 [Exaiptasia diaphana]